MKKYGLQLPILAAVAILLLVLYIVTRSDTSPVAKFTQWFSNMVEGFAAPIGDIPRCPTNYRFFNDKRGDSFCCAGKVNPFSHTCEAKGPSELCSFQTSQPDPRNPGQMLPNCNQMITKQLTENRDSLCPGRFPHYASIGKCCLNDSDLDGYDCTAQNTDPSTYCVIGGTLKPGEQSCQNLKLGEQSNCPAGLQKMTYTMGQQEVKKYGSSAMGKTIPVCFGMESSCIPNNVIQTVQKDGIFTDKTNLDGWKYSCGGYERVYVNRDTTGTMDNTYV